MHIPLTSSCKLCVYILADCNKNPCENGGTCTVENNEVICTCKGPYTGKLCDKSK